MTTNKLRRLIYTSGTIGMLGVLVSTSALDRVVKATARGDAAIEAGIPAISAGGGPLTPEARPALVDFERANSESSRATLLLGLSAMLTPLLIFLNVVGFAGSAEPESTYYRSRRANREEHEGDDAGEPTFQLRLPLGSQDDPG